MNLTRRQVLLSAAASAAAPAALAQKDHWPSKPLRIVVPYPPGGSSDIIARAISNLLAESLKQSVVVENKPGANGNLGADVVAKSAPDGYTLLLCDVGALAISPSVYPKLAPAPSKELRGVTMLAYSPHLLVVHPSVPTIAEPGAAGSEPGSWQGVLVPRGTPTAVVDRLNAELVRAIRNPEVRARLAGQGAEVVTTAPQEQDQFLATERKRWAQVVATSNIKAE